MEVIPEQAQWSYWSLFYNFPMRYPHTSASIARAARAAAPAA